MEIYPRKVEIKVENMNIFACFTGFQLAYTYQIDTNVNV